MIDDDESRVSASNTDGSEMLYDYFKYLTSLCVFSLGGVLALADRVPADGRGKELLVAALGVLCLAGLFAFTGVGEMVKARSKGVPVRPAAIRYAAATPLLLAVGLGMFTYLFTRSLF